MISGYPKSIGIPWVDGLSTGLLNLGHHIYLLGILLNQIALQTSLAAHNNNELTHHPQAPW